MSAYRELLLGCGRSRQKMVLAPGTDSTWRGLVTLDINPRVEPDVVLDLEGERLVGNTMTPGRFGAEAFDEVHAYEVLEHLGAQGDVVAFFYVFFEIWQVLKPGGYLCGTVPSRFSPWLWGDPGHRRAILPESLHFLHRPFYAQCDLERPTSASDYRGIWHGDFDILRSDDDHTLHRFVLQAVKPARGP